MLSHQLINASNGRHWAVGSPVDDSPLLRAYDVREFMKTLVSILAVILLVGCAATGAKVAGSTTINFEGEPGPIVKVTPVYPEAELAQHKQGSVTMSFVVGNDGKATDIRVIQSAGRPFEEAAVSALKKALYHPKFSGTSVTVVAEFAINRSSN